MQWQFSMMWRWASIMTTRTPTDDAAQSKDLGASLPDLASLSRLANELFCALPGTAAVEAAVPGAPSLRKPSVDDSLAASDLTRTSRSAVADVVPSALVAASLAPNFYFLDPVRSGWDASSGSTSNALRDISALVARSTSLPTEADLGALLNPATTARGMKDAPSLPGGAANFYFLESTIATADTGALKDLSRHPPFSVAAVRRDFPILAERVNGRPLIWLDNAATTQKPQVVIDRLAHFYAHENSNIHRAAHELAARATDAYEDARDTVAQFIGAPTSEAIVFVRGTTEAINLVAHAWGGKHLQPGDEIVITHLEHHANIVPWQLISQKTGAILKWAPIDNAGNLLLSEFEELLGPRTKLVAASQVSNALGTVVQVDKIVELGHRYGARVLIDGAQSIQHMPVNVSELGADFFVFSGHKIYGPTGIGALYGTEEALTETPPWQGGGHMIADVTTERSLYQGPPTKFEAGTGNIADAVGLTEALRYVQRLGIERIAAYEHTLLEYATPRLADIPGVRLVGTAEEKASVLSFVLAGHEPLEVGKALNAEGIAVRAGHHCAQPALRRLGLEATVRPSFSFYNTHEEIDVFLNAVRRIAEGGTNVG